MKLNRCVQVAVGLVAGSGVVIILSGSALAANNSQDTVIQNGQHGQRVASHGSAGATLGPADNQQSGTQQSDANQDATQPTEQPANGVSTADNNSGQSGAGSGSNVGSPSGPGQQASSISTSSSAQTVTAPVKAKGGGTGGGSSATGSSQSGQVTPANEASISAQAAPSEVAVIAPTVIANSQDLVPQTTLLRIQPVITNRATAPQDLAAAVPTAPAPARAPNTAKSSGLLGSLVVGLAGVVVPQTLVPPADVVHRVAMAASFSALVVLLLNVFLFSFGLWLRRGGFATAARSDAPSAGSSSFATPLLLGYVTSPPDLHSPILMVSETNTSNQSVRTAFRKEVMR